MRRTLARGLEIGDGLPDRAIRASPADDEEVRVLRAEYLVPAVGYQKIQGRPFKVSELTARSLRLLAGDEAQEVLS